MKKVVLCLLVFILIISQIPKPAKADSNTKYITLAEFVQKLVVSLYEEPRDVSDPKSWADKYSLYLTEIGAGDIGYFHNGDQKRSVLLTHSQAARIIYQVLNKKSRSYSDDAIKYIYSQNISCGYYQDKADYFDNFDPMGMVTEEEASTLIGNAKIIASGNTLPSCGDTMELKNTIPDRINKIATQLLLNVQIKENPYFHGAEVIGEGFRYYLEYSEYPNGEMTDHFELQYFDNTNSKGIVLITKTLIELGVNMSEESLKEILTAELNSKTSSSSKIVHNKDGLVVNVGHYQLPSSNKVYHIGWAVHADMSTSFADLDNHWAKRDMQWAIQRGITSGYNNDTVRPDASVTEAEFLAMLFRSFPTRTDYRDNGDEWSTVYYQLAQKYNYPVEGIGQVEARTSNITRGNVAELIAATQGQNYSEGIAIRYLYDNQFAEGANSSHLKPTISDFKPDQTLTRAEAVKFIRNLYEHSKFGQPQSRPLSASEFDASSLPLVLSVNGQVLESQESIRRFDNILYIPLEPVIMGMGGTFKWVNQPFRVSVTKVDGTVIEFANTSTQAKVNGKSVPVSTQTINTETGSFPAKPRLSGKQFFIPIDTVESVLGYTVKYENDGDKTTVYVGKLP